MVRLYKIKWHPVKDEWGGRQPVDRTTLINIPNAKGVVAVDAKRALNVFINSCGGLKKNVIAEIIEMDENGNQIGEKITPTGDSIIPVGR